MINLENNRESIRGKLLKSMAVSFLLTGMLVFFGPVTIYLNNAPEFDFRLAELVPNLIPALIVYFVSLSLFLMLLPQRWKIHQVTTVVFVALAMAVWIQANLLPWSHGVLDGSKIEWEKYPGRYALDVCVWIFIILFCLIKYRMIYRHAHKWALGLLVVQIGGFIITYTDIRENDLIKSRYQLTEIDKYNFSEDRNVLVIVIDTTEVSLFQKALQLHPEYTNKLDGFYFLPDNLSSYPSTLATFVQMLTGKYYKNEKPFDVFKKEAFLSDSSIPKRLKEEGCHVFLESLYPRTFFIDPAVADNVAEGSGFKIDNKLLLPSLFRQLPFPAKRCLMEHAADISLVSLLPGCRNVAAAVSQKPTRLDRSNVPYPEDYSRYHDGLNYSTRYDFEHFFDCSLKQPAFKFYHMLGTHRHNRKFAKSKNRLIDLDVCMKYMFDIIQAFKENGIYDRSTIIILADHGARVVGEADMANFNAMLLIKPMQSTGHMKIADRSFCLSELSQLTYALSTTNNQYRGNLDAYFSRHPAPETRYVYHYIWHGWENEYLPQLTEYAVTGSLTSNGLTATGRSYSKTKTPPIRFTGSTVIDFTKAKAQNYLEGAWKRTADGVIPENHIWKRPSVVLRFADALSPNAAYYAELKYANPANSTANHSNGIQAASVRYGLDAYTDLKESSEFITLQLPVRIYSRADKELRFSFDVPAHSNLILQSVSFATVPPPMVPWGQEYRLSSALPEHTSILCQGWHNVEQDYVWAGSGSSAFLRFRLDNPKNDLSFRFSCAPFLKPGCVEKQRVGISVNGQELKNIVLTNEMLTDCYVEVPRELVVSNEVLVAFNLPDTALPATFGEPDIRPLAIRLSSIRLEELGAHYINGHEGMLPYLSTGWSWPEQNWIWNNGSEAKLGFRVATPKQDLAFVFRCKAFIVPGKVDQQRIRISANGQKLGTLEKTSAETEEFSVIIPKELVTDGKIDITFGLPDAASPQNAGTAPDPRMLAIALTSIMMQEQYHAHE